jgi:hypothetical protein
MPLLSSLPLELRQLIAESLEPTSLRSFNLTSIACHEASLAAVFRRICITVHTPEGLLRDVNALGQALSHIDSFSHAHSFSYIRQIKIKGAMILAGKENVERWPTQSPWSVFYGNVNPLLNEDPIRFDGMYAVSESVIEATSGEDMAWTPLVNLLENEIPLQNLVFHCRTSQFPQVF